MTTTPDPQQPDGTTEQPEPQPELYTLDMVATLGQIEDYARYARAALADEHEANVRHYTLQLAGLAAQAAELVRSW